jgi:hypothetical protein
VTVYPGVEISAETADSPNTHILAYFSPALVCTNSYVCGRISVRVSVCVRVCFCVRHIYAMLVSC